MHHPGAHAENFRPPGKKIIIYIFIQIIIHNNIKTPPILPAKSKISKPNPAESGKKDRQIRQNPAEITAEKVRKIKNLKIR